MIRKPLAGIIIGVALVAIGFSITAILNTLTQPHNSAVQSDAITPVVANVTFIPLRQAITNQQATNTSVRTTTTHNDKTVATNNTQTAALPTKPLIASTPPTNESTQSTLPVLPNSNLSPSSPSSSATINPPLKETSPTNSQPQAVSNTPKLIDQIFDTVNKERQDRKLASVQRINQIDDSALAQSAYNAQLNRLTHDGGFGRLAQHYPNCKATGEIIEHIPITHSAQQAVNVWINSPPHNKIMFSSKYDKAGIGLTRRDNMYYVVMQFCS